MKTTQTFRNRPTLVIGFLTITCVVGSVRAATVYQQPLANNLEGIFSNQGGQEVADSVLVATPISVTHITWYGFYGFGGFELNPAVELVAFSVRFLPDLAGAAGNTSAIQSGAQSWSAVHWG